MPAPTVSKPDYQIVTLPSGEEVEFPAAMSDADIQSALEQTPAPSGPSAPKGPPGSPISFLPPAVRQFAFDNVPRSAANFASSLYSAVRHPIDTAGAMLDLAAGAGENLVRRASGVDTPTGSGAGAGSSAGPGRYIPPSSRARTASAAADFYADRYGSPSAIANTLYEDPVGALGDASVVAGGGAALLKGASTAVRAAAASANLPRVASAAGKVARVAEQAGQVAKAADPAVIAGKSIAKVARPAAARVSRVTQALPAASETMASGARRLYRSAISPNKATAPDEVVEAGMRMGAVPSEHQGEFVQVKRRIQQLDRQVRDIIQEQGSPGSTMLTDGIEGPELRIDPNRAVEPLTTMVDRWGGNRRPDTPNPSLGHLTNFGAQGDNVGDVKAVARVRKNFLAGYENPNPGAPIYIGDEGVRHSPDFRATVDLPDRPAGVGSRGVRRLEPGETPPGVAPRIPPSRQLPPAPIPAGPVPDRGAIAFDAPQVGSKPLPAGPPGEQLSMPIVGAAGDATGIDPKTGQMTLWTSGEINVPEMGPVYGGRLPEGVSEVPGASSTRSYGPEVEPAALAGHNPRGAGVGVGAEAGAGAGAGAPLSRPAALRSALAEIGYAVDEQLRPASPGGQVTLPAGPARETLASLEQQLKRRSLDATTRMQMEDQAAALRRQLQVGEVPSHRRLTGTEAHEVKKGTMAANRRNFGKLTAASSEAEKSLAHSLRTILEGHFPEIAALNQEEAVLVQLRQALVDQAHKMRKTGTGASSLGTSGDVMKGVGAGMIAAASGAGPLSLATGIGAGALAKVLRQPAFKAKLALALEEGAARQRGREVAMAGAVAGAKASPRLRTAGKFATYGMNLEGRINAMLKELGELGEGEDSKEESIDPRDRR